MKDFKDNTRERSDKDVIKRLISYMIPYKKQFIFVIFLMIFGIGIQITPPLIIGFTVDVISSDTLEKSEQIKRIILITVGFILALGLGNLVAYYQNLLLQKIGQKTVVSLRNEVFLHIEKLAIGQINQVPVGKLVTRVTNDTNTIGDMYT